jgi:hypothetical protein
MAPLGIGIGVGGRRRPGRRAGGSSWDAGLLNDATFSSNSFGDGTAAWGKATGTLTLYGDTTSNRGVANFLLTGLTNGASYRLTLNVLDEADTRQVVQGVLDANTTPGSSTPVTGNMEEGIGEQSFDFVFQTGRPYLQFFTANLTGTWSANSLRVVAL